MRFAIFTDTFTPDPNGVAVSTSRQYETLVRAGYATQLFGPSALQVPNPISSLKIFTTCDDNYSLRLPLGLAHLHRKPGDEIVIHSQTPFSFGLLGKAVAKLTGAFSIYTHHTNFFDSYLHYLGRVNNRLSSSLLRRLYERFISGFDAIIVPTETARAELTESIVVQSQRIFVLPTLPFHYEFRLGDESIDRDIDVIFVSRLAPEKNVYIAVQTILELHARAPHTHIAVVGDGVLREHVLSVLRPALGVRLKYFRRVPNQEVHCLMRRSRVFLFTSLSDTQGLVIDEALMNGAQVVAVACPLTHERLARVEGSMLVHNTSSDLCDAIGAAISVSAPQRITKSVVNADQRLRELESNWITAYHNIIRSSHGCR